MRVGVIRPEAIAGEPAPAAVMQWGKTTRVSREIDFHIYLGRWWRAEAGFLAAADWRWRAWEARCSGVQARGARLVAVRGEVRDCQPLFIGAGKAVTRPDLELEELRAMAVGEISRR
jgi:hypothetical protein